MKYVTVYQCTGTIEALRYVIWTKPDYSDLQMIKVPVLEYGNLAKKVDDMIKDKIAVVLGNRNFEIKKMIIYGIIELPRDVAIKIGELVTADNATVRQLFTLPMVKA